jgi:hypothetical protein
MRNTEDRYEHAACTLINIFDYTTRNTRVSEKLQTIQGAGNVLETGENDLVITVENSLYDT